jgi:predicted GH43/DUF377 family glycosyl hydrolase
MLNVKRSEASIRPDSRRVVARPFIPGFVGTLDALGGSRVPQIVERILALSPSEVADQLARARELFGERHRDLEDRWEANFLEALPHSPKLSSVHGDLRTLIGAYFTQEYSFEAAALCNPSIVPDPEWNGEEPLRFIMSARAIGEGHISSIEFRTGTVTESGEVTLEEVGPLVATGRRTSVVYQKLSFLARLEELGADPNIANEICGMLPERFTFDDLARELPKLDAPNSYPASAFETIRLIHWLASSNYRLEFVNGPLSERLIFPAGPSDSHGMEDARFVRFTDDDGSSTYYATYTAYDGFQILPQLIETSDFLAFDITTMSGMSARNKGLALFPVKIDGRYAALSRHDRERLYLSYTEDIRSWDDSELIYQPRAAWEMVQVGNCGSPIETDEGWLVITHGVGPMRRYCLGALLLDRKDPSQVLGRLAKPLLEPGEADRDGYVPNVVYSCGGLAHGNSLVLPFGVADHSIGIAIVPFMDLINEMV